MAQRAFMADAGIKLHDWTIVQDNDGNLQVSNTHTVSGTQKLFRVDTGLRMGDWRMTVDSNGDMLLSETALTGPQRPFIADAGVRVGAWTLYPTEDGDLYAKKEAILPNYTLTSTSTDADEGSTITFTLATEGVDVGTTVPYTIAGVTSADIGGASLTGNFVTGTTDSISVTLTEDNETDPGESIWLTLQNGQASQLVAINDTSTATVDLSNYTYTLAITDSNGNAVTSVNEGSDYTLTVTSNAPDGSVVWFHLVEDIAQNYSDPVTIDWLLNGSQSIAETATITNGTATKTLSMIADSETETGYENFKVYISTTETFADIANHYQASTAWISINDTSQTPLGAESYNWTVTTSFDTGNPDTYNMSASYLDGTYGQIEEGATAGTWTITTDAPDGTQIFTTMVNAYLGTYQYGDDPNTSEYTYPNYPSYGWKTVVNGQITGTWQAYDDNVIENGEVVYLRVGTSYAHADMLARSEWFELRDPGTATGGAWTPPSAGETFTGGEGVWESNVTHGQWYTASGSSTGNPRVYIRQSVSDQHDLAKDIDYALTNMSANDTFLIGTTSMTVTGNITKSPDPYNSNYRIYEFDVNVAPSTSNAFTYFYEFTVTA